MDGFELAKKSRNLNPKISFLSLTARNLKADILTGLKIGADDYITKPFEAEELLLRINNIISRSKSESYNEYIFGSYTFYHEKAELIFKNESKTLTVLEDDLLKIFLENSNKIVTREAILKARYCPIKMCKKW